MFGLQKEKIKRLNSVGSKIMNKKQKKKNPEKEIQQLKMKLNRTQKKLTYYEDIINEKNYFKMIDPIATNMSHFKVIGKIIKKIDQYESNDWSNIVFKQNMLQKNSFKIKFIKICSSMKESNCNYIGIIDSRIKKEQEYYSYKKQIGYGDCGAFCFWQLQFFQHLGSGFEQGQTVEVLMSYQTGSIEWRVQGKLRHLFSHKKLEDKEIRWLPYVNLGNIQNQIQWID